LIGSIVSNCGLKDTGVYRSRGETIAVSWNVFQSVNADWKPLEMVGAVH
jgi:hypothetical protein